jgi:hypothetical protein
MLIPEPAQDGQRGLDASVGIVTAGEFKAEQDSLRQLIQCGADLATRQHIFAKDDPMVSQRTRIVLVMDVDSLCAKRLDSLQYVLSAVEPMRVRSCAISAMVAPGDSRKFSRAI